MWIVKLGGSLATADNLPVWLDMLRSHGGGEVVIVPGGGPFAELVLKSQEFWCFDNSSAHFMALLAMAQYGLMLAAVHPDLVPVEIESDLREVLVRGGVPIWLPTLMVNDDPDIEHSWDVTSDSLSAWLAGRLRAGHLLLVKSVSLTERPLALSDLARRGIIDAAFPRYALQGDYTISVLSEDQYDLVPLMLSGDSDTCEKVQVRKVGRRTRTRIPYPKA